MNPNRKFSRTPQPKSINTANKQIIDHVSSQISQINQIRDYIGNLKSLIWTIKLDFQNFLDENGVKVKNEINDLEMRYKSHIEMAKLKESKMKQKITDLERSNIQLHNKSKLIDKLRITHEDIFMELQNLSSNLTSPSSPKYQTQRNLGSPILQNFQAHQNYTSPNSPQFQNIKIEHNNRPNSKSTEFFNSEDYSNELKTAQSSPKQKFLESEIKRKNKEIEQLKFSLSATKEISSKQESIIKMLEGDKDISHGGAQLIFDLKTKIVEIEDMKTKLEYQNELLRKDYASKIQEVNQLNQIITDLNIEKKSLSHNVNKYRHELKTLKNECDHALLINEIKQKENKKLTEQINEIRSELIENRKTIEIQNESIKQFKDFKTIISNQQNEIIRLQNKLKKLKTEKGSEYCTICNKVIDKNELIYFSNCPYHINCVKCPFCNVDNLISINPKTFLCKKHFDEYHHSHGLPEDFIKEYHEKTKENIVEIFSDENRFFSNEEIKNQPAENIFISNELVDNSYQIDKPYDCLFPTVEFHFESSFEKVDFDKLNELLEGEMIITNAAKGSLLLTLAIIKEFGTNLAKGAKNFVEKIKNKLKSPLGKAVVGNLKNKPEIKIPNDSEIQDLFNKPSINILQLPQKLQKVDIEGIRKRALKKIQNEKKKDWKFLLSNKSLFDSFEKQLKDDCEKNAFEIIIIGHTVIANKNLKNYDKVKSKIPSQNIKEVFLYHGSRLKNHPKIVESHFLMPGEDDVRDNTDYGFYGKGIYATDNLFYASLYGNQYNILKANEKTCIMVCRCIYDKSKVIGLKDLSFYGREIESEIKNNFGIHQALVGNKNRFKPIKETEMEENEIVANEFVFPDKYQICPILSLMIMRADHFILWKDDHINNDENTNYLKTLSEKIEVNFYHKESNKEAIELLELKRFNRVKLITNGGEDCNGKELIEEARKIFKSNFVCLVFALSLNHGEWVSRMENVLLTNNPEDFKAFAALKMNKTDILDFIQKLEKELNYIKFKINEKELLHFPLADQEIDY